MQANPRHVKTLFFLKKCRHGGFSGEREKERESQRECTESFTSRSQEVGVGFMRIGEGCGGTCKGGSCCFRPYMRAGKSLFFTHSATLWQQNSETLSCKMRIFNGGLLACERTKAPGAIGCYKLHSRLPVAEHS